MKGGDSDLRKRKGVSAKGKEGEGREGEGRKEGKDGWTDLLASLGALLGSKHGSVGRGLVPIGLDLHTTGDPGDGLLSRKIGNVNEGVVEARGRGTDDGRVEQGESAVRSCCRSEMFA